MGTFKTYCFPLSSDAVANSWTFCSLFASFLLIFSPRTVEHFCCNWLFTVCLGHTVPTLKFFAFWIYLFFFFFSSASVGFWLLQKEKLKKNKESPSWGKCLCSSNYNSVVVALFLQLYCYLLCVAEPMLRIQASTEGTNTSSCKYIQAV